LLFLFLLHIFSEALYFAIWLLLSRVVGFVYFQFNFYHKFRYGQFGDTKPGSRWKVVLVNWVAICGMFQE